MAPKFENPILFTLTLGLALGLILMGGGCNSSDPASTPADGGNAHGSAITDCSVLLTQAEAGGLLGAPVVSVTPSTLGPNLNCRYKADVIPGDIFPPEISITAFTTDGIAATYHLTVPAYYSDLEARTADSIKTTLTGVGTKAMYMLNPRKLAMYKGDVYTDITFRPHGIPIIDKSDEAFEGAKATARVVASHL